MKRLVSLNLIFIMIFMLCSCNLTVTQTDNTATEKGTELTAEIKTEETTELISEAQTTEKATEKTTENKTEASTEAETTVQKTTKKAEEKTTAKPVKQITCTVEISCENILKNKDKLKENKAAFLPKNGLILGSTKVTVPEGSTAFDVIKKACADNVCTDGCVYCKKNGIQLDYVYTPAFESYYIRGVHQIYEKDCGTQSGWMYSVNGVFPNYGCNQYKLKDGDTIRFSYTCEPGDNLGAGQ